MRIIKSFEESSKKQEAFKAGTSAKVAEKMFRVLSKKVGSQFIFSDYPTEFSNKIGKFIGYYATLKNTLVRINFLLANSDNIYSLDIFGKNPRKPDTTLDLMGSNIIQVLDQIADYFTGDLDDYEESLWKRGRNRFTEVVSYDDLMKRWIEIEGNDNLPENISNQRVNFESEFRRFGDFCRLQNKKEPKHTGAFLLMLKKYVKTEMGGRYKIPSIEVLSGLREEPINTSKTDEQAFNNILTDEHLLKFRVLEFYVSQVAKRSAEFSNLYVYGDGGIGKSYLAKKYLEPLPETTYITGKFSGYSALVKILFNNKDNRIIVFDDTVSKEDMKNSTVENILKAALDPDEPRRIQIKKANESSMSFDREGLHIFLESKEYDKFSKETLHEENEVVDMTALLETPTDFYFNSQVVFLTNYPKVPQALQDRCWALEMIFSNQQIMEIIEINVEKIAPDRVPEAMELFDMLGVNELTDDDKKDVIDFMKTSDSNPLVKRKFSIRVYKRLLSLYIATKHTPLWEKFLLMELSS